MEKELLYKYNNGNYEVLLYSDGTKIKRTEEKEFIADFPDSIDLKITDYCDGNCPMCHENSSVLGKHATFDAPFLKTLKRGTELAVGGGNALSHPSLIPFLEQMKAQGVVCNITVNERHLLKDYALVEKLIAKNLVYGVGVSINEFSPQAIDFLKTHENAVAHLICGVVDEREIDKLKGCKALFLGYKLKGRGKEFFSPEVHKKIIRLRNFITNITKNLLVTSFDNLALSQLKIKTIIGEDEWAKRFMGDDGESTMFIDLVQKNCASSSTSTLRYPLSSTIEECFSKVRKQKTT